MIFARRVGSDIGHRVSPFALQYWCGMPSFVPYLPGGFFYLRAIASGRHYFPPPILVCLLVIAFVLLTCFFLGGVHANSSRLNTSAFPLGCSQMQLAAKIAYIYLGQTFGLQSILC